MEDDDDDDVWSKQKEKKIILSCQKGSNLGYNGKGIVCVTYKLGAPIGTKLKSAPPSSSGKWSEPGTFPEVDGVRGLVGNLPLCAPNVRDTDGQNRGAKFTRGEGRPGGNFRDPVPDEEKRQKIPPARGVELRAGQVTSTRGGKLEEQRAQRALLQRLPHSPGHVQVGRPNRPARRAGPPPNFTATSRGSRSSFRWWPPQLSSNGKRREHVRYLTSSGLRMFPLLGGLLQHLSCVSNDIDRAP